MKPLAFVLSLNLNRRHLTDAQKAVLALDVLPFLEAKAKTREAKGRPAKGTARIPDVSAGESRDQAAAAVGVNPRVLLLIVTWWPVLRLVLP